VLVAEDVWNAPVPNYAEGAEPTHYLHGLSAADREMLFGALPATTAELAFDPERPGASAAAVTDQARQTETMKRILDLRNASKKGIEAVNRQRIIDEFGANSQDTGNQAVQAALLTHKIRELWSHSLRNSRDIHNRRALRLFVQKRARVLKYVKSKDEASYEVLLADLGLHPTAVEGELKLGF
jgi:small subunit ribosomal protein S15